MTDVLMFIEDPGAVNFMAPVIPALQARGLSVALRVAGTAAAFIGTDTGAVALAPEGSAVAVLAAVRPRIVITGTSENMQSLGFELTTMAQASGLPTVAMVDGPSNAPTRFRGGSDHALTFAPDHILVPDAATAAAYVALNHPKSGVIVCGHPHYDWVRGRAGTFEREGRDSVRKRVLGDVPSGRQVVVFAAEVSTGLVPAQYRRSESYTLHGHGANHFRTEVVIEEFLDAVALLTPRPHTILRLHPKNMREELALLFGQFDAVSEGGSALDLVFAADAVVGMTSILLAEAAIIGRPVLAVLPRPQEYEWLPSIVRGQIPFATTRLQVQEGVAALLSHHRGPGLATIAFEPNAAAHAADVVAGLLRP